MSDQAGAAREAMGTAADCRPVGDVFVDVYQELRSHAARFMSRERLGHTLEATAVVHETYLRLLRQKRLRWEGRDEFLGIAVRVIRQILVEHARRSTAAKRGGGRRRVPMSATADPRGVDAADLLEIDEGIRALSVSNERQARIVEMRFYGGMSVEQIARVLDVCPRTVKGEWRVARAWLRSRLSP